LHAARKRLAVARFGDQVQVIALHGEVDEPEAEALLAAGERQAQFLETSPGAERRDASHDAHRHMDGMMS
jgi:hypothetical protein